MPSDYAGASGRLALSRVSSLSGRYLVQPKLDGQYARAVLDSAGRVSHLFSRANRPIPLGLWSHIRGAHVGRPHAEYAGELEAHTEAGRRAAAARGYALLHLFDCLHDGRRSLRSLPYTERRAELWRHQSEAECYGPRLPWYRDRTGRAHDRRSGDFVRATPTDWRLCPIVPQEPLSAASRLWCDVEAGQLEGLVCVAQDAPLGRRRSKLKVKPLDTLDCLVLSVDARAALVQYGGRSFVVGRGRHDLVPGQLVEVSHNGWYEHAGRGRCGTAGGAATPRFARILRTRSDLGGSL